MEANAEVLVIGGGIAGAAAALSARAAGRQVAVVRAGPGSTALTGGAWVGDVPEPLSAALAAVGYVLHPVGRPLAHPTGELYPADFAPPEHAGAVVDDGTLICGVSGLPAFHAPALARLWGDTAGRDLLAATVDAGQAPASGWSVPSLAATLERNPDRFVDAVARAVREADARRVILPAVLGIEGHDRVRSAIEQATGAVVAEALGTPPSLPGWRLDRALLAALERAGIHVHAGRAGSTVIEGRRVSGIRVAVAEDVTTVAAGPDPVPGSFTITADAVVLATGKFLGGGIRLNGDGLQEPALGCPVWVERFSRRFSRDAEPLTLTGAGRTDAHPLLAAGVHTDEHGRPVDERGDVVYENVFVAGAVRAGVDASAAGLGNMAASGWAAGRRAAEAI